jgi:HEAT repeats/PBS lyase HEAT-like repeat
MCVLVGIGMVAFWPGEREPEYNGKRLSEWIWAYEHSRFSAVDNGQSLRAIREIGTNAVPWLLKWMRYETPKWRIKFDRATDKVLPRLHFPGSYTHEFWELCENTAGFKALGVEARDAIPALTEMVNQRQSMAVSRRAIRALAYIGADGLPPLMTALTDPDKEKRMYAAAYTGFMQPRNTNLTPIVPLLAKCATDDFLIAHNAVETLGKLRLEPMVAVPVLTNALGNRHYFMRLRAAEASGQFGEEGYVAVPALAVSLNDPESVVREAVTNALRSVAPQLFTNEVKDF